jgi:glutaconate CoA-transferase subunit B
MTVDYAPDEMMAVAAARMLENGDVCLVGIGVPGNAACLAKAAHAPDLVLVYESGCMDANPSRIPLTVGDGELAATAKAVVPVFEMFTYWIQPGRIGKALVSAAQIDRRANLNTTVVGNYARPTTRLPGAGGAPEIVAHCRETLVVLRQSLRSFVDRLDFRTSVGFGDAANDRRRFGLKGKGPTIVITDLGILRPHQTDGELELCAVHSGITVEEVRAATGWPLRVAASLYVTKPPNSHELATLRSLLKGAGDDN